MVNILACCNTDAGTVETPRLCITLTVEESLTAITEVDSPNPGREISLTSLHSRSLVNYFYIYNYIYFDYI